MCCIFIYIRIVWYHAHAVKMKFASFFKSVSFLFILNIYIYIYKIYIFKMNNIFYFKYNLPNRKQNYSHGVCYISIVMINFSSYVI